MRGLKPIPKNQDSNNRVYDISLLDEEPTPEPKEEVKRVYDISLLDEEEDEAGLDEDIKKEEVFDPFKVEPFEPEPITGFNIPLVAGTTATGELIIPTLEDIAYEKQVKQEEFERQKPEADELVKTSYKGLVSTAEEKEQVLDEAYQLGIDEDIVEQSMREANSVFYQESGKDYKKKIRTETGIHLSNFQMPTEEGIKELMDIKKEKKSMKALSEEHQQVAVLNKQLRGLYEEGELKEANDIEEEIDKLLDNRTELYNPRTGEMIAIEDADQDTIDYNQQADKIAVQYVGKYGDRLGKFHDDAFYQWQGTEEEYNRPQFELTNIFGKRVATELMSAKDLISTYNRQPLAYDDTSYNKAKAIEESTLDRKANFDMINRAYLINEDPSTIEKSLVAITAEAFGEEILDLGPAKVDIKTELDHMQDFQRYMNEAGFKLNEEQQEGLTLDMVEQTFQTIGSSLGVGVKIGLIVMATEGTGIAGALEGFAEVAVAKNLGKSGEYIFNLVKGPIKSGAQFELTPGESTSFAMGAGEEVAVQALKSLMGRFKPLTKWVSKQGKVLDFSLNTTARASSEFIGEYTGDYLDQLTKSGFDYEKAFEETFGRTPEGAADKAWLTAITSLFFTGPSNLVRMKYAQKAIQEMPDNTPHKQELLDDLDPKIKLKEEEVATQKEVIKEVEQVKKEEDAIKEPSTEEIPVQPEARISEGVRVEDTEGIEVAREGEVKPKEVEKIREGTEERVPKAEEVTKEEKAKVEAEVEAEKEVLKTDADQFAKEMIDTGQVQERVEKKGPKDKEIAPRIDFQMPTKQINKGIKDIKAGKIETAAAKKLTSKLKEFHEAGNIPMIEGTGGKAVRTGVTIDQQIGAIQESKVIEPVPEEVVDQGIIDFAKEEGITLENLEENKSKFFEGFPYSEKQYTQLQEHFKAEEKVEVKGPDVVIDKQTAPPELKDQIDISGPEPTSVVQERKKVRDELTTKRENVIKKTVDIEKPKPSKSELDGESSEIVQEAINPIKPIFKGINKFQEKVFAENVEKAEDWVSGKVKQGLTSKNRAARLLSKALTSWSNGLPRTQADITKKRQFKGGIDASNITREEMTNNLRDLVGNDPAALIKVHQVLDPELYEGSKIPTYEELTDSEKTLYDQIREVNDYIHDYNYAMGFLPKKTYDKFKGKYIARAYTTYEVPADVEKFIEEGNNAYQGSTKLNLNIFKARKEVDAYKKENHIDDPVFLTAKRMMQTEQNAAILNYANSINEDNKLVSNTEKEGFTKLEGKGYGPLADKYVVDYIAEDFKGFFMSNKILDTLYDAFKYYDKLALRQFLKKYHTVYSPVVQLGNATSNFAFGFVSGIDPVTMASKVNKARKEIKNRGKIYKHLVKNGILGSDIITEDFLPLNREAKERSLKTDEASKTWKDRVKKFPGWLDKKVTDAYGASDNIAKISAYLSLTEEYGVNDKKALEQVYRGFQNYATVGKIWDVAAKTPLIGNPYVKFQADLQRIVKNAVLKRPLSTAAFLATLNLMAYAGSRAVGESEEEKEVRESRAFIPKINLPNFMGGDIPLVVQSPVGEINIARFISPYYSYDVGSNESTVEKFTNYLPYNLDIIKGREKRRESILFAKKDVLLGPWWSAIIDDVDFRGKSIQDPKSTKFRSSGASSLDRAQNASNYILRSQFPYYSTGADMYSALFYGTDFYGRDRDPVDVVMNKFLKIQDFGDGDYKRVVERQLTNLSFELSDLEQQGKDVSGLAKKEIDDLKDKKKEDKITLKQFNNSVEGIEKSLQKSLSSTLEEIAKKQEDWDEIVDRSGDIMRGIRVFRESDIKRAKRRIERKLK